MDAPLTGRAAVDRFQQLFEAASSEDTAGAGSASADDAKPGGGPWV